MPNVLTPRQLKQFEQDGIVFPVSVLSPAEALHYRTCLGRYEQTVGHPIQSSLRHNVHLLFTWANELVRHPAIVNTVEDVLGPNVLCWASSFFIKEANDPAFVSWHQDSTYWGLEPHEVVTVWVALSDVSVESGAMKMLPGSHKWEQLPHVDTFHENNLLSRGQEVQLEINEAEGRFVPLTAGEISLHHIRTIHGSAPNRTDERRVGLAIRYLPPHVRQIHFRDSAMLVRGVDEYDHFDEVKQPGSDLDAAALAAHQAVTDRLLQALMKGTDATQFPK